MYFPKSQITSNLYTNGEELVYVSDNTNYKGSYFKTSTNQYFSGTSPQDKPNFPLKIKPKEEGEEEGQDLNPKLTYINQSSFTQLKNIDLDFSRSLPSSSPNIPSSLDYTNKSFKRYFCKKTNQIIYLEINKDTYDKLVKQDKSILFQLYIPFSIPWILNGNKGRAAQLNANATTTVVNKLQLPRFLEFIGSNFTKYYK